MAQQILIPSLSQGLGTSLPLWCWAGQVACFGRWSGSDFLQMGWSSSVATRRMYMSGLLASRGGGASEKLRNQPGSLGPRPEEPSLTH